MNTTPTETKPKKIGRTVLAKFFHDNGYEPISPHVFYREMFPQGELAPFHEDGSYDPNVWRYNGIILHRTNRTKMVIKHNDFLREDLVLTRNVFKKHLVYDDLIAIDRAIEEANSKGEQVYMAPVSYLGRNRDENHERFLYALTLEVDDLITEKMPGKRYLRQKGLETALHQWGANNSPRWEGGWFLAPTAVTCSGRGIHCHWFLKEPVPLFGGPTIDVYEHDDKNPTKRINRRRSQWKWFRQRFADYVWNNAVSSSPIQREAIGQAFRMVGSLSKDNKLVEAFWISKRRYSIEELLGLKIFGNPMHEQNGTGYPNEWFDFCTKSHVDLTKHEQREPEKLIAAREQWPEWYERRIVHKQPPRQKGHWHIKPDLYEWYKKQIRDNPHVGCRYYRLYTLAQYGAKCDIPFDVVKQDCIDIGETFKLVGDVPLEDWEISKAYAAYFDYRAFESTIDFINSKAHLNIEKNKRNGQKQHDHLQADILYNKITGRPTSNACKNNREVTLQYMRENGLITGRPPGSGSKREQVEEWQSQHPDGTKMECHRETGLSRTTIDKWWSSV